MIEQRDDEDFSDFLIRLAYAADDGEASFGMLQDALFEAAQDIKDLEKRIDRLMSAVVLNGDELNP